jgi:hypothetical protein
LAKKRLTAMLCGSSTGEKLEPFFVVKATYSDKPKRNTIQHALSTSEGRQSIGIAEEAMATVQPKAWFDNRVTVEWAKLVF